MSFTTGLLCPTCVPDVNGNEKRKNKCTCSAGKLRLSSFTAASYGDLLRVKHLVEDMGRSVNNEDSGGYTMLHYAAQHKHKHVVEYLCKRNAEINANSCGSTPLHRAAYSGSLACVAILVESGADLFSKDTTAHGKLRLPIHKAADQGHVDIVSFLLSKGSPELETITDSDGNCLRDLLNNDNFTACEPTMSNASMNINTFSSTTNAKILNTERGNCRDGLADNSGMKCPVCGQKCYGFRSSKCSVCPSYLLCSTCSKLRCKMCNQVES